MIVMTVMTLITCVLANIIENATKNHESGKALRSVSITILSAPNPKRRGCFKKKNESAIIAVMLFAAACSYPFNLYSWWPRS
jgi:hypothetical protein